MTADTTTSTKHVFYNRLTGKLYMVMRNTKVLRDTQHSPLYCHTIYIHVDKTDVPPLSFSSFEDRVYELHAEDDKGFKEEYKKVTPPSLSDDAINGRFVISLIVRSFLN